jgi:hypothetical protein
VVELFGNVRFILYIIIKSMQNLEKYRKRKREYAKTPNERKKRTEYMRLWREKNRDKHNLQSNESHHRNKHKHIDKVKNYHLMKKYGINL